MAKFTAPVRLNIRWNGLDISGAAGATHRIPDAFVEEFTGEVAPGIPGGVTWITQDETSGIPTLPIGQTDVSGLTASLAGKFDKTGGIISGATTVTAALVAQASVSTPSLTATSARFKGAPHYDVKGYGAVGDSVTDDTVAVQAALSAANGASGGVVVLPIGTYLVSATLDVPAGVSILGMERATKLLLKPQANCSVLRFAQGREDTSFTTLRQYVRDLMIDGNGASQTSSAAYGIEMVADTAGANSTILFDNIWVQFTKGSGYFVGAGRSGNTFIRCAAWSTGNYGFEVNSSDNQFIGCSGGLNVINAYINGITNHITDGQWFRATGAASIYLTGSAFYCAVSNAGVDQNGRVGIYVGGGYNKITGNILLGNSSSLDNGYAYIEVAASQSANVVAHNIGGVHSAVTTKGSAFLRLPSSGEGVYGPNTVDPAACYLQASSSQTVRMATVPRVAVKRISAQAISTGVITTLTFDSEREDSHGFHSTLSNTSRLSIPSGQGLAGRYRISAAIAFASNSTGIREVLILLNGTTYIAAAGVPALVSDTTYLNISRDWTLADSDFVEVQAFQTSGGNLNVLADQGYTAEFTMSRIDD